MVCDDGDYRGAIHLRERGGPSIHFDGVCVAYFYHKTNTPVSGLWRLRFNNKSRYDYDGGAMFLVQYVF